MGWQVALSAIVGLGLLGCDGEPFDDVPDAGGVDAMVDQCEGVTFYRRGTGPSASLISTEPKAPAGGPIDCDPVAQTGCAPGEKCAQRIVTVEPWLASTTCVPDGTLDANESCDPDFASDSGYDECRAGLVCIGFPGAKGACVPICDQSNPSCGDGECVGFFQLFDDHPGTGACMSSCSPTAQDCAAANFACYVGDRVGATCGPIPTESVCRRQDDPCFGPDGINCFLNGCDKGYGNAIPNPNAPPRNLCAQFCDPAPTTTSTPGNARGNPDGVMCPEDYVCRYWDSFWLFDQNIPPTAGFCVPDDGSYFDCTVYDPSVCTAIECTPPGCIPKSQLPFDTTGGN